MNRIKVIAVMCSTVFAVLLSGCGGGNAGNATIGGTVTGLTAGTTVTLTNGNTTIPVSGAGSTPVGFAFPGTVASGGGYSVTVSTQPANQTCLVTSGSGVINYNGTDIANISVSCTANVPISVSVSGLAATNTLTFNLALQNDLSNPTGVSPPLTVTGVGNGTVTGNFASLSPATVYAVTLAMQPTNPSQVCTVMTTSPSSASGGVIVTVPVAPIVIDFNCI